MRMFVCVCICAYMCMFVCMCVYVSVCDDCRKMSHHPTHIVPLSITKGYYHYLLMNNTILLKESKLIIQMQRGLLHWMHQIDCRIECYMYPHPEEVPLLLLSVPYNNAHNLLKPFNTLCPHHPHPHLHPHQPIISMHN